MLIDNTLSLNMLVLYKCIMFVFADMLIIYRVIVRDDYITVRIVSD